MIRTRACCLFLALISLASCGDSSNPARADLPGPGVATSLMPANASASRSSAERAAFTTVEEILSNAGAAIGKQVELQGRTTQPLGTDAFIFDDGTGTIPASFVSAGSSPPLNQRINVVANVGTGTSGFPASLLVNSWEAPKPFSCDNVLEARARFSNPGFVAGNVVGLFVSFRGVPDGDKSVEIDWGNGDIERIDVGAGTARADALFDVEGVVGHTYTDLRGSEEKRVRATLTVAGRAGQCGRVRSVIVGPGSGPGFAAGGALRLTFNDPVPSGGFFSVTATVSNPTTVPFEAKLLFRTPDRSSIRTKGSGCTELEGDLVECVIPEVSAAGSGSEFVQYNVPVVSKAIQISGSVTLLTGDLAPTATYRTTITP